MSDHVTTAETNHAALPQHRPWMMPIWKPAKGKWGILLYIVLIHALAVVGLVLFPAPGIRVFGRTHLLTCLGGLGTTVGYHRYLAHRTLRTNKFVEQFLIFAAVFNGSGHPTSWVAYHRYHHSKTDTPEDISSPRYGGFWWAHLRWLYQSEKADTAKWCPDLSGAEYRAWHYAEPLVILLSLFCGLVLGWAGFFWIGAIRLVYSLHMQCFVNSLLHFDHSQEGDSSRNVWWLGPLQLAAWGENWHRNHHAAAGSARLGWHWWQVDIGWYFICTLEILGLASNVKRPRRAVN